MNTAIRTAIGHYPRLEASLAQDKNERADLADGYAMLAEALGMAAPEAETATDGGGGDGGEIGDRP